MRNPIAKLIWLLLLLATFYPVPALPSDEVPLLPLLRYDKLESYGKLQMVAPAGYFEIGRRYVHAPRVEWQPIAGADCYKLVLLQNGKALGTTRAASSPHFIEKGWEQTRPGKANIVIEAYDAAGKCIALSRLFPLYVAPGFSEKAAAKQKRGYAEAAWVTFQALDSYQPPAHQPLPTNGPASQIKPVLLGCSVSPAGLSPISFPNLHDWSHVDLCVALLKIAENDAQRKRVRGFATSVGEHILMCRLPKTEGWQYGGMPRGVADWQGGPGFAMPIQDPVAKDKHSRLVEPGKAAYSAEALLKLFEILGAERFKQAGLEMAETLLRTQLEDGSWPARVDGRTGEVIAKYSTSVAAVISLLERVNGLQPDPRWGVARDKALVWMEKYPMRSYGWVVNFDDNPAGADTVYPYVGLSNWDLFHFIRYLCGHPGSMTNVQERIREQLDWNDNHFVFYGEDLLLPFNPYYPTCGEQGNPASYVSYGGCWLPMDFHTANWGRALLRMFELTGDRKYLRIARASANALTQYQLDDGRTLTWMPDRDYGLSSQYNGAATGDFWPSGWAMSATLWAELAAMDQDASALKSPREVIAPSRAARLTNL